jgi:hypothetical protein
VLSRLDVDLAGDHLVPEVRDDRRDEREPILALGGGQHPEMLDTRYLRLLQGAADGRLRFAGCTVGVRFASTLGGRFLPAPTLGRCMGVTTSIGLRHNHQR